MGCGSSGPSTNDAGVKDVNAETKPVPTPKVVPKEDPKPVSMVIPAQITAIDAKKPMAPLPNGSRIVFVLGGPGSGKGTHCEKILGRYKDVNHFSAGDLLRDAVKNGNTELESIMKEGKLVPMEVTIGLLNDAMVASGGKTFLIDGFPRAMDQAEAFEKQVRPCDMVLAFDCPEEEMRKRLLKRGETSGRADDNEATIVKRFRTFVEQSKPVIEHYKGIGKCEEISSIGDVDTIFGNVCEAITKHLPDVSTKEPAAVAKEPTPVPETPVTAASVSKEEDLPEGTRIIFVLGGPGSGKGTQCEKILTEYTDCGVHHLSAGDLLRDAVKNGNAELETIMKEGKLVPMEVTIGLLKDAMIASGGKTFLIDGFPRAWDQAEAFEKIVQPCDAVLFFDCSEEEMRKRLLKRGETSGRADDNEETIVKRFRTFVEQSKPVVDEYNTQTKVHEINAMRDPAAVFADVKVALDFRLRGIAVPEAPKAEAATLPDGSTIIFVLGGPGSGKGTQCEKILEEYESLCVKHLSAGDLLRDAVKNGNAELEAIMKEGKLVPMEVTIGLLKDAMIASGSKTFLIDGFPRAWDQAEAFEKIVQPCDAVLFFDCSEEEMRKRLLKRGETSGRADDNEETIVKRFRTFVEQSKPVVDEYNTQTKVHEINAMRDPAAVFADVKVALDFRLRGIAIPEAPKAEAAKLPDGSKIIFVLGGPGSGKGTQCEKILEEYESLCVKHLSAGDLLRDAVKNGNAELEEIMKEGKLVPMEVTIGLLKDAMIASGSKTFLIDGFPRAWDQAEAFEKIVQPCDAVLFFDCSEEEMRKRLLKRGETSGRADDNEETIVKRFHTFVEQSKPVVEEYKTQNKVFEISSEQMPDEVFAQVKQSLDGILC